MQPLVLGLHQCTNLQRTEWAQKGNKVFGFYRLNKSFTSNYKVLTQNRRQSKSKSKSRVKHLETPAPRQMLHVQHCAFFVQHTDTIMGFLVSPKTHNLVFCLLLLLWCEIHIALDESTAKKKNKGWVKRTISVHSFDTNTVDRYSYKNKQLW